MRTSELKRFALNWAVAKCQGAGAALCNTHSRGEALLLSDPTTDCDVGDHYDPSTNWAQGGPIIEREGIALHLGQDGLWWARIPPENLTPQILTSAPTPLIAAMRCYVASKLGDEVDVPNELKEFTE